MMATITPQPTQASARKHHSLKMDMTPMVDLGFLLIAFFIFTATLSQPGTTRLIMPNKGESTPVAGSKALTFLLDKQTAYVYEGRWEDAVLQNKIVETTYDLQHGIGAHVRQKQKLLSSKVDLMVIIKPLKSSSYQNIIAALDEMQINHVTKYAVVDASLEEHAFASRQ